MQAQQTLTLQVSVKEFTFFAVIHLQMENPRTCVADSPVSKLISSGLGTMYVVRGLTTCTCLPSCHGKMPA